MILRERFISPEQRQKIVDDLRLMQKFRTRNCTEKMMNHEKYLIRTLNLKTSMKKSKFCDYGNAYIHVNVTIPVPKKQQLLHL